MPKVSDSCRVEHLSWDSANFGLRVGRVEGEPPDGDSLSALLESAATADLELVYWFSRGAWLPAPELMGRYRGRLVDRKTTFSREILRAESPPRNGEVLIEEVARQVPTTELLALGVSAGGYSRFRVDPRFPPRQFRNLYETWTARSLLGEIADATLVATLPEAKLAGFITLALNEKGASIGLVAVAASERGRGVGSALLDAAHRWAFGRGMRFISVVTQGDNLPACRLYHKAGYEVSDVVSVYHFWPSPRRA